MIGAKDRFPGLAGGWHYLDTAATAQKPQAVIDATVRAMGADYATVHRGVYARSANMTLAYEAALIAGLAPSEVAHAVFHQPNVRFPLQVAAELGFTREQLALGLLSPEIGNAYAGSTLLGLSAVLDGAQPGQRIVQVSFGSGAGSDAFSWQTTGLIDERRDLAPRTRDYLARQRPIDYATYLRYRGQIVLE